MFYSQSGEDRVLFEHYFKFKRNGIFLELGALDGVLYSNTKFFEDNLEWTGILIEANPFQFDLLKTNRPKSKVYHNLVSDNFEELDFKFFHDGHAAVSGVNATLPSTHNEIYFDKNPSLPQSIVKMKPRSLTDIVKHSGFPYIDFFSLDVEGHELNVLRSYDFLIPIKLILVESLDSSENDLEIHEFLLGKGYLFFQKLSHNKIYIHRKFLNFTA